MIEKTIVKTRDSNIELLRILTMVAVVILHINNTQMGGILLAVSDKPFLLFFARLLESLCVCAVNIFVIISGYFLTKSNKRNVFKIVELVFQVILISVVYYLLTAIFIYKNFSFASLLYNCILKNWFVVLYGVLFIISPYINIIIDKLSKKQYLVLLTTLFIIFSMYATLMDVLQSAKLGVIMGVSPIGMYGSQEGYTIVNFVFMYLIAGYLRKFDVTIKSWKLSIALIACIFMIALWSYFNEQTAWSYCNPFVVVEAVIIFLLFKNMKFKNKIINTLATSSFMVYLTHTYLFFVIQYIPVTSTVGFFSALLILPIVIYLAGSLIYLIYHLVFGRMMKKLSAIKLFQFEPLKEDDKTIEIDIKE